MDGVNGLLVPAEPEAVAEAVQRLFDNRDYARQLSSRGRDVVADKWSLPAAIDGIEQALERVVQSSTRTRLVPA